MAEVINNIELLHKRIETGNKTYYWTLCLNCYCESKRRLDQIKVSKGFCKYCKDSNKKSNIDSVINNFYRSYKNSANQKKLIFNIDRDLFKKTIESNCYYCENEPIESATSKLRNFTNKAYLHNGIDRIDSNKGYEEGNIVACCSMCNYMKRNYTTENFLNQVYKIYNFKKEKDE